MLKYIMLINERKAYSIRQLTFKVAIAILILAFVREILWKLMSLLSSVLSVG